MLDKEPRQQTKAILLDPPGTPIRSCPWGLILHITKQQLDPEFQFQKGEQNHQGDTTSIDAACRKTGQETTLTFSNLVPRFATCKLLLDGQCPATAPLTDDQKQNIVNLLSNLTTFTYPKP